LRPPPIICVDFDGTVVDHEYPGIGALKPGVREALESFRHLGYKIIISSCRTCMWYPEVFNIYGDHLPVARDRRVVKEMVAFLDANQIPYDEIDDGTKGKPVADFYIDDKAIRFEDNWPEIVHFVREKNT